MGEGIVTGLRISVLLTAVVTLLSNYGSSAASPGITFSRGGRSPVGRLRMASRIGRDQLDCGRAFCIPVCSSVCVSGRGHGILLSTALDIHGAALGGSLCIGGVSCCSANKALVGSCLGAPLRLPTVNALGCVIRGRRSGNNSNTGFVVRIRKVSRAIGPIVRTIVLNGFDGGTFTFDARKISIVR